jgi:NhaA family Na+:H+ antiporter
VLWVCVHESGVHATLAGVALGLLTPTSTPDDRQPIEHLEHRLHPLASFVVVPVFALANAGIALSGSGLRDALGSRVAWGIVTGLVVGKVVGVAAATGIGVKARIGRLPTGVTARDVLGGAALAGIGFTVSLFVVDLTFADDATHLVDAKLAVLVASVLAGVLATLVFTFAGDSARTSAADAADDDDRHMLRPAAGAGTRRTGTEVAGARAPGRRP